MISIQTCLEEIWIGYGNNLNNSFSLKIMKQIRASTSLKTIDYLDLSWCNWENKVNCEELANLLANADSLTGVDLYD